MKSLLCGDKGCVEVELALSKKYKKELKELKEKLMVNRPEFKDLDKIHGFEPIKEGEINE